MPPMPPAPGAPAAAAFLSSSLMSAMRASVVSIKPAMEAAFCSARRVTLAGSITPIFTMSPYSPVSALKPKFSSLESDLADHNGAFMAGVESDLAGRLFESAPHDACTNGFVIVELELLDCSDGAKQRRAAAGDDTFLDSRAGGMHSVFDTGLLFLQFGFGGCADFDDGNAADQLGKAFLQLFLVVVGGGVFDLGADLLHTAFDVRGLAGAFDDRGVVLVDGDLLGAAEVLELHILELDAEVFGDGLAASKSGDVFEH